jgi:hypothetical protein
MEKYKLAAPDVASQTVYFSDHPLPQISQRILFKAGFLSLGMHALLRLGPDLGALIFDIAFCEIAFKKDDMAFYSAFFSFSADSSYFSGA